MTTEFRRFRFFSTVSVCKGFCLFCCLKNIQKEQLCTKNCDFHTTQNHSLIILTKTSDDSKLLSWGPAFKGFVRQQILDKHVNIHTGERPFRWFVKKKLSEIEKLLYTKSCDFLLWFSMFLIFLQHFSFAHLKVRKGVGLWTIFWAVIPNGHNCVEAKIAQL